MDIQHNPSLSLANIEHLIVPFEPMEIIVGEAQLERVSFIMSHVVTEIYKLTPPVVSGITISIAKNFNGTEWRLRTVKGVYYSKGDNSN